MFAHPAAPWRVFDGQQDRRCTTALYELALSDAETEESWEKGGSRDIPAPVFVCWNAVLAQYEKPPMVLAIEGQLRDNIARRKRETAEAWY
ncbi:MAG: trimethylamine methyltransferase family protein [Pseudomonadota bacterium]